ncbi:holocytochrome c synthase [Myotisia sp. PD_48]|nr:holocytochrome c synthase [Myotisia sp. PD_48]
MGWFWASPSTAPAQAAEPPSRPSQCPVQHSRPVDSQASQQNSCPVRSQDSPFFTPPKQSNGQNATPPAEISSQPYQSTTRAALSKLNPLNYMFSDLSQSRAPNQTVNLPVEREISTIPRADNKGSKWEYPSPQQMYNAMLRKGYTDTPQDAVESMVAVHNFLNEGAWQEIVDWEHTFSQGLKRGWERCRRGSENLSVDLERERTGSTDENGATFQEPQLLRFMGRPQERTPKATMLQVLANLYPSKYGTAPPFDRHDWYIQRQTPSGPKEVRYVIDYYSAPPEPTGEPVFYLDIRPAVDTPTAAIERLMKWGGDVWWRASGAATR